MDVESEQPNSSASSTAGSSSNNSSSSNLLANLPMLPLLHSDENMETDNNGERVDEINDDINLEAGENFVAPLSVRNTTPSPTALASSSPSLPPPPPPSQPQPPTTLATSSNDQFAANIANNSIFISPLFLNNNSSSTSDTTTSNTPSSSSTTTTPPHQEHSSLSSSHQQLPQHQALSSFSQSSSSPHLNTSEPVVVPIVQEQTQTQGQSQSQSPIIFHEHIADTIDASVVPTSSAIFDVPTTVEEDDDGDVVITAAENSVNSQEQRPQSSGTAFTVRPEIFGETPNTPLSSPPSPTLPLPPPSITTTSTSSLPLTRQASEEQPKRTQFSYSSYFASSADYTGYANRSSSGNNAKYFNNNNQFGFGNGSSIIGGTVASMFSNNDNNSAAAGGSSSSGGGSGSHRNNPAVDRIKLLYPNVDEEETPLPRSWSPQDKCLSIGLSQNNLRVHYKGGTKQHSDAASVRTAYPIPPSCGLYYFEVKIISKGKNGHMGIGLTTQQFRMNRLPGWDKQSYGYHGDDGNSFSSSSNGQSYGPTFTTGDVVGCCVNFVNGTCFYTKNGHDLGIAFRELPAKLFPTVGLQTPGEEVDANFGQEPFKFDQIEDMMKQMRTEITSAIYTFPMPADQGDTTALLHKMVISYLVHNGHSQTAEAFARATSQTFREDLSSIRNRQKILKLVMSGRMGQAIELTLRSYPSLLENNKNLWFMLKCRQFVEMVNGSDIEYCPTTNSKSTTTNTTQTTPPNQTSVIQSTKTYQNGKSTSNDNTTNTEQQNSTALNLDATRTSGPVIKPDENQHIVASRSFFPAEAQSNDKSNENLPANLDYTNDVEMENNGHNSNSNGDSYQNGNSSNHINNSTDLDEDMDVDISPASRKYTNGIERILEFGKELSQMGQLLEKENKMKDEDRQMLEDAFSLIAYSNPWSSPLGWQLCPTKRETVCIALNSAILESMNYSRRPPLDICVGHVNELLRTMAQTALGACAFVNIDDIFPQH